MSKLRKQVSAIIRNLHDQFLRQMPRHDHRMFPIPGTNACFHCLLMSMDDTRQVLVMLKNFRALGLRVNPMPAETELVNLIGQEKINRITEQLIQELEQVPRKICPNCKSKSVIASVSSPRRAVRMLSGNFFAKILGECYSCKSVFPFYLSDFKGELKSSDDSA